MKISRMTVFNFALIVGLMDFIILAYSGQSLGKAIALSGLALAIVMLACEVFNKVLDNSFYEAKA